MHGYILNQQPYRETSLLLNVFTQEEGRLSLVAPHVKSKKNMGSASILQSFVPLWLEVRGRAELQTLVKAEQQGPSLINVFDMRWLSALYVNELLLRALPLHEAHAELFTLYEHTLKQLSHEEPIAWILRCFEKKLLALMGYALPLDKEISSGESFRDEDYYYFIRDKGFLSANDIHHHSTKIRCYQGKVLKILAAEMLYDHNVLPELKHLLKEALKSLIGEKPLKTAQQAQAWAAYTNK